MKATCMECQKELGRVSHTHLKTHGMTIAEYTAKYPGVRLAYHPPSQAEKIKNNSSRSEKIRVKKLEYWSENKGKNIVELWGPEKAAAASAKHSEKSKGSNNPAYGKVYANAGGRNIGHYKGVIFRSLYEYSFLKMLEKQGFNLVTDVVTEPFRIPFIFEGTERTFSPDYLINGLRVVEIKSVYETTIGPLKSLNDAKFAVAKPFLKERGMSFEVLTEDDIHVITKKTAHTDASIIWSRGGPK